MTASELFSNYILKNFLHTIIPAIVMESSVCRSLCSAIISSHHYHYHHPHHHQLLKMISVQSHHHLEALYIYSDKVNQSAKRFS